MSPLQNATWDYSVMRAVLVSVLVVGWVNNGAAQDSYKVAVLKGSPPSTVALEQREATNSEGFRISDSQGHVLADIWLRKSVPGAEKPAGPKDTIQFPFLADGEFLGAMRFEAEGHDYRDQPIAKGTYTIRYGLQPVNGDHLGVSTFRDYSLILPAAKDLSLARLARKQLEQQSASAAGTSHPAVFLLLEAPADAPRSGASMIHDDAQNTWSVVLPLSIQVKGSGDPVVLPIRLVVVGKAPV
jgi:hypothetical protein